MESTSVCLHTAAKTALRCIDYFTYCIVLIQRHKSHRNHSCSGLPLSDGLALFETAGPVKQTRLGTLFVFEVKDNGSDPNPSKLPHCLLSA